MKLCANTIPRPSLNWLSRTQVWSVRDKLIGVFPAPGEALQINDNVEIYPAIVTKFVVAGYATLWLKCPKTKNPYWDISIHGVDSLLVEGIKFNDPRARRCAALVKHFYRYFPFPPTDNYLTHPKDKFYA